MNTKEKRDIFVGLFKTNTYGANGMCQCGISHYDDANQWDPEYHETELPAAKESAKTNPSGYQFHDSSIEYLDFNGALYVQGCRCAMDDFIFNFLTEDKSSIVSFYKKTQDRVTVDDLE